MPTCNFDLILLQMWGFAARPCDRSSFLNLPFSVLLGEDSGVSLPQIIESVAEVAVALGRWAPSGGPGPRHNSSFLGLVLRLLSPSPLHFTDKKTEVTDTQIIQLKFGSN